jgi:DNA-directed RNA polymerase specialized sigma24 family protein
VTRVRLPIDVLEDEWRRELAGTALAEHLRRWRIQEPALRPFEAPVALLRYLRHSRRGEGEDAILCALLSSARDDRLAARLVLVRLLPGLKRRAGRVLHDPGEREEVWSALLARAWERICAYPVERLPRHVAANLILSSVRDVLEALGAERSRARLSVGQPSADLPDEAAEGSDVDAVLDGAVAAGALSAQEADLIARTRLDDVLLEEAAAELGISRHALVMRRLRAERRLFLYLGLAVVTHRGSVPPLSCARVAGTGSTVPPVQTKPKPVRR